MKINTLHEVAVCISSGANPLPRVRSGRIHCTVKLCADAGKIRVRSSVRLTHCPSRLLRKQYSEAAVQYYRIVPDLCDLSLLACLVVQVLYRPDEFCFTIYGCRRGKAVHLCGVEQGYELGIHRLAAIGGLTGEETGTWSEGALPAAVVQDVLVGQWHKCSDRELELYEWDTLSARHCCVMAAEDSAPDHRTFSGFRTRLVSLSA